MTFLFFFSQLDYLKMLQTYTHTNPIYLMYNILCFFSFLITYCVVHMLVDVGLYTGCGQQGITYIPKENLLSLLEAIKHQQLLSKGWDLTSPSSPHAERLDPIQVLCRQSQLLRAHKYSSFIQNTVSRWSFCFLFHSVL